MFRKNLHRVLALTIVLLMLLAVAAPAMAATYVETKQSVAVRASASSAGKKIATIKKGVVLEKLGTYGNWTRVEYEGSPAYILTQYLTASTGTASTGTSTGTTTSGSTVYATGAVNVRKGPSTSYAKLSQLKKGQAVNKLGEVNNWALIEWGTGVAYVSMKYLTAGTSSSTGSSTTTTTTTTQYVYFTEDDVPVRSGPSTSYRAIAYMDTGEKLEYVSVYGTWYEVRIGSTTGYVSAKQAYLRTSGTSSTSSGGYVYATSSIRVYKSASTSSDMYGYLYMGDVAERIGTYGSTWTMIRYNGYTGYVQTSRIVVAPYDYTAGMWQVNAWRYAASSPTYCYSVPVLNNSYRTGYLSKGESVYVFAQSSSWAMILVDGSEIMYCNPSSLTTKYSGSSSGTSTYNLQAGDKAYVAYSTGTTVYASSTGTDALQVPTSSTVSTPTDYGSLNYRTVVTIQNVLEGSRYLVSFKDDRSSTYNTGKYFVGYVSYYDLSLTYP